MLNSVNFKGLIVTTGDGSDLPIGEIGFHNYKNEIKYTEQKEVLPGDVLEINGNKFIVFSNNVEAGKIAAVEITDTKPQILSFSDIKETTPVKQKLDVKDGYSYSKWHNKGMRWLLTGWNFPDNNKNVLSAENCWR